MKWRTRRKLIYTTLALLPLFVVAGVIYVATFFPEPTCFDGEQNQNETGIDCGGVCDLVCQEPLPSVDIVWDRAFLVSDSVYNLAAYIENPNSNLIARDVPYVFRLYDTDNILITERRGQADIPPQPTTVFFASGVDTNNRNIGRTVLEFTEEPFWERADVPEVDFDISNRNLTAGESPRLSFEITNRNQEPFSQIQLTGIVFAADGDAAHVSQTIVEYLDVGETAEAIFTWRRPFPTRTVECVVPSNVMLLIDRSGSMNDEQENPPQPFTAVQDAATEFTQLLSETANSGLVTFATEASLEQSLSDQHFQTLEKINSMFIRPRDESGYTNLGDAILKAREAFQDADNDRNSVMIILTDGKANRPEEPGGKVYAQQQAQIAKHSDIHFYTIGLGDKVDHQFLENLASVPENHYRAIDRSRLSAVYSEIHSSLCEQAPFITEIIPTSYQPADR